MPETIGVLSILEGPLLDEAQNLWKLFESKYGSKGVQSFALPNLTFLAGTTSNVAHVEEALAALVPQLKPFELQVDGLGCFDTPGRVVYLRVRRADQLNALHRTIHIALKKHCDAVFDHYLPYGWVPHVTVAMNDLQNRDFLRAMFDLRDYRPFFRQTISNISLVVQTQATGKVEIVKSMQL